MASVIQPVVFRGRTWGSPGKPGGAKRPAFEPDSVLSPLRNAIPDVEIRDAMVFDSAEEAARLRERAGDASVLLVLRPELLSVTWAAPALRSAHMPTVLFGWRNSPGAVLCDLYGYLRADGVDVTLALDFGDIARCVRVVEAQQQLAEATMLVVGEGFPSWSQVANPTTPEQVTDRLGTRIVTRTVEELLTAARAVDQGRAQALVAEWTLAADDVTQAARAGLVEAAQAHIALEAMVREANASAVTVDCRMMDEVSMEEDGSFLSPCMSLTVLRDTGIPAACEADVNVLLSMVILEYLAKRPTFMGNLNQFNRDEGWIAIAHCAATTRMDGYDADPAPLHLEDYHGRGTGVATYSPMREGEIVTIARLDRDQRHLSLASGPIVDASHGKGCINQIRVEIGDVQDFVDRCMAGDHYAVVYGNLVPEARKLCRNLNVGVWEPGNPLL